MNKDTINLRDEASFQIEVFPNVFWISAGALGKSRYTDLEIKSLDFMDPAEKQRKISNLYEAIQLFQASRFAGIIDNVRVIEEDTTIMWTFHKNGHDAVRTNEGCCASDSNWLSYILKDVYSEIGCFGLYNLDGNGHIINYIKHEGWYYFVDMMMQRHDSAQDIGVENGDIADYARNYASGYIHKAKCFEDYIQFCISAKDNPPALFYKTKKPECVCIGQQYYWNQVDGLYNLMLKSNKVFFYPEAVEMLYWSDAQLFELKSSKAIEPNWSKIKSFDFTV